MTLLGLCMLGAFFGRIQTSARNAGRLDFVTRTVQGLVNPLSAVFAAAADSTGDFFNGILHAASLTRENRRLKGLEASAQNYSAIEKELLGENQNLRKLLKLPSYGESKRIPARVIGFLQHENRMTVSVGRRSGVVPGLPVVCSEGLIGTVQTVDETTCQLVLVTSTFLKVGAVAVSPKSTRAPQPGLLRGETNDSLLLEFLETSNPVDVGDLVITSGLSEVIPRGIPIGRVVQVDNDPEFGTRKARVRPSVKMGSVSEVFILK